MQDTRFHHSVLFLTQHTARTSFALAINRPTEHRVNEILEPLSLEFEENPLMYWGGPVSPSTVWMLHDSDWQSQGTAPVTDQWSITSHAQMFTNIQQLGWPQRYRLMFGHCGWGPGQLAAELEGREPWSHRSSWLVLHQPDPDWLVNGPVDELWRQATAFCGQQTVDTWMA
jgi:putative transcriptional regulator